MALKQEGALRQSQVITTYGPGSLVDLPDRSVIVGGLEYWTGGYPGETGPKLQPISEERLVAKLKGYLKLDRLDLFPPPVAEDIASRTGRSPGIQVFEFPEWFVADWLDPEEKQYRARPLVHKQRLVGGKFEAPTGKKCSVVAVRFVQGCEAGHVSDLDWFGFTHNWESSCRRQLWLEERGTSGELVDLFVRCECGKDRSVAQAQRMGEAALGPCRGARPWLLDVSGEGCKADVDGEPPPKNRLLLRSASNAYFSQVLRAISIPEPDTKIRMAVETVWLSVLSTVPSREALQLLVETMKLPILEPLSVFGVDAIWSEIERRRGPVDRGTSSKPLKTAEIETLLGSSTEIGEDVPTGADFFARRVGHEKTGALRYIERVVLVHRLREVVAQLGFTRFEAVAPDIDGELKLDLRRAALAKEIRWLPAIENRGEGFFLSLRPDMINAWLARKEVKKRGEQLLAGHAAWAASRGIQDATFAGLPYYMLHSLSHLLISAVSLDCGYSTSSIRERIYAGESGYGILLYTGGSDAEGTLGGLVEVGRRLARSGDALEAALDLGRLCAHDPVCAQHRPDHAQEERFLNGAACHGCLLIGEPSCEKRNELLDRQLVIPTVVGQGAEFFQD
jgi:hypothetical protein